MNRPNSTPVCSRHVVVLVMSYGKEYRAVAKFAGDGRGRNYYVLSAKSLRRRRIDATEILLVRSDLLKPMSDFLVV